MIWLMLGLPLLAAAFFQAGDTALSRAGKTEARRIAATALCGRIVSSVLFVVLLTLVLAEYCGEYAALPAVLLAATLLLLFAVLLPRAVALSKPQQTARITERPLHLLGILLQPFVYLTTAADRLFLRLCGGAATTASAVTEAEIRSLIELGHEQGVLEHDAEEMLTSVFDFRNAVAAEVMTPRVDLPLVPLKADIDTAAACMLEQGVSRLAAYEDHPDQIVGFVHIEDVLRAKTIDRSCMVADLVRSALVVPESKAVADLFAQMRKARISTAVVADEYGVSSGVITLEDLVEYIVGDLWDEHDPQEAINQAESAGGGVLDGRMSLDEVNDALNIRLSHASTHTLGGWIFHTLGRLPHPGDSVSYGGLEFQVVAMDRWRVDKVRVTPRV